ncbi:MAG: PQQ-binding-like beta-propeller repeat protein [Opitutaceae bacterium]
MDAKNILILGIKGSLVAFRRDTGEQLWKVHLKSNEFVTVVTDETRVYAHTKGELHCVDLLTGQTLWSDPLKGLGYDLASIAGPGLSAPSSPTMIEKKRQDHAAASSGTDGSSSS